MIADDSGSRLLAHCRQGLIGAAGFGDGELPPLQQSQPGDAGVSRIQLVDKRLYPIFD